VLAVTSIIFYHTLYHLTLLFYNFIGPDIARTFNELHSFPVKGNLRFYN
jgi:hypothetical protein